MNELTKQFEAGQEAYANDETCLYDKSESFIEGYRDAAYDHLKYEGMFKFGYEESGQWWDDIVDNLDRCPHGKCLRCEECADADKVNTILAKAMGMSLATLIVTIFWIALLFEPQELPW